MLKAKRAIKQVAYQACQNLWQKWTEECQDVEMADYELLAVTEFGKQLKLLRPTNIEGGNRGTSEKEAKESSKENKGQSMTPQTSRIDPEVLRKGLDKTEESKEKEYSMSSLDRSSRKVEDMLFTFETEDDILALISKAGLNGSNLLFDLRNKLSIRWHIIYTEDEPQLEELSQMNPCQHL